MGAYAASKSGAAELTASLAEELAALPLTVNAVLPTIVDTLTNRQATLGRTSASGLIRPTWRRWSYSRCRSGAGHKRGADPGRQGAWAAARAT